jgi:hypothetical protein
MTPSVSRHWKLRFEWSRPTAWEDRLSELSTTAKSTAPCSSELQRKYQAGSGYKTKKEYKFT